MVCRRSLKGFLLASLAAAVAEIIGAEQARLLSQTTRKNFFEKTSCIREADMIQYAPFFGMLFLAATR